MSEEPVPFVNITRFILDELRLTPEDAVIVKMDVEGAEWDILPGPSIAPFLLPFDVALIVACAELCDA